MGGECRPRCGSRCSGSPLRSDARNVRLYYTGFVSPYASCVRFLLAATLRILDHNYSKVFTIPIVAHHAHFHSNMSNSTIISHGELEEPVTRQSNSRFRSVLAPICRTRRKISPPVRRHHPTGTFFRSVPHLGRIRQQSIRPRPTAEEHRYPAVGTMTTMIKVATSGRQQSRAVLAQLVEPRPLLPYGSAVAGSSPADG